MWDGDILERKKDANFLEKYLTKLYETGSKKNFIININSPWGFGKTFFLSKWKEDLEKNHLVIYYDAWANDFTSEPLVSFIATIEEQIAKHFDNSEERKILAGFKESAVKIIKSTAPVVASILIKQLTGLSADKLNIEVSDSTAEDIGEISLKAAEEALLAYNEKKESISGFKKKLTEIVRKINEKPNIYLPIFIFIDELDRCKPTYAISLLEAIKHIFDVEGFYFVIATDSAQLIHSIRAVYGSGFDSARYLKRFFDREYKFSDPDYFSFTQLMDEKYPLKSNVLFPDIDEEKPNLALMSKLFSFFKLSLRDVEQCFSQLQACSLTADESVFFHGFYLLYLICLKHAYVERFNKEIAGAMEGFDSNVFNTSEVVLTKRFKDQFNVIPDRIPLAHVIETYRQNRDIPKQQIGQASASTVVETSIYDMLRKAAAGDGNNLREYQLVVNRSGRLI